MSTSARPCSIAAALQIVGERWALLAIREIFLGNRRFDEIARNTGASRDILTARLRSLETAGVLTRRPYQDRPARYEYHLTEAGRDLAPVLTALRTWGDTWVSDTPPVTATHTPCGHPLTSVTLCPHCHTPTTPETTHLTVNTPDWTLKGPTP
ncbi:helix-turn-helix transcriptional regulator [Actinocorallia sp. API 0066]|uniref:winged helix-turn-helix transcriptional regulator n=1 Tax=Actinocorallia sp. API 0066 TaxID=2896846 RepID=UPI001E47BCBE|nr:helix-turn-helix domain-containing protein [Actinocorallia sp. API 0066]MCD0450047.1 helix-turn-helix transcriptional regulator [Actinocorallia sp. API 0066]